MTITLRQESNARATTKNDVITFEEMDNNFIHLLDNGIIVVGDDSTGTTFKLSDTLKVAGTQNITTAVSGDTLTITGPDLTSYATASSSTAFTNKTGNISQWTNDSGYLTSESNDLSSTVTWANVPDANITQSSVTQHQSALSITESQISDLGTYLTNSPITVVGDDSTGTTFNSSETIKFTGSGGATVAVSGDTVTITAGGGGGASTGDVVFQSTTMSSPTNSDLTVEANGTGNLVLTGNRVDIANSGSVLDYWNTSHWQGPALYTIADLYDGSYRVYGNSRTTDIRLDTGITYGSNSRTRNGIDILTYDLNGNDLSGLYNNYIFAQNATLEIYDNNSSSGQWPTAACSTNSIYHYNYSGGDTTINTPQYGVKVGFEYDYDAGDLYGNWDSVGFYFDYLDVYGTGTDVDDGWGGKLISHNQDIRWIQSDLATVNGYMEAVQRITHNGGALTLDLGGDLANIKKITLAGNITGFDFTNANWTSSRSHSVTLLLCQDATGGRTVSFTDDAGDNPTFLFVGGNKTIDTTAGAITVVHFMSATDYNNSNKILWNVAPAYTT